MISDRVKSITPSFTIGISSKVTEMKKKGLDVVNLSIGEPDFNLPEKAKQAAITAIQNNKTKYDNVSGLIDLRNAITKKLKDENKVSYNINEIIVSNGAKHAITNALFALLNPGDEVLIPVPYWVSYPEMVKLAYGVPVFIKPSDNKNYKIAAQDIQSALTPKTKLLFLNNPSNPSGVVYSREELAAIAEVCLKNNIYILADEIYEPFCFDSEFTSVSSISEEIKAITILVNGFSKSATMTGLRVGYTASNEKIAKAISTIQGHLTSHPCTVSQWAGVSALSECHRDIDLMVSTYKRRRNTAIEILDRIPEVTYLNPQGAFYIFINVSAFRDKIPFANSYSIAFCNELLEKQLVAVVPGIAFGMDDFIRISYACDDHELVRGLEQLESFILTLK